MSLYNRSIEVWPYQRYVPYHYASGDELFVPSEILPDVAELRIREFAEHQFREKSYYLGISPMVRNRAPVHINIARMMAVWRSQRLDPLCPGVYFALGYNKKIVAYEGYDRGNYRSSSYDRTYDRLDHTYDRLDRTYDPLHRTYDPLHRTYDPLDRTYDRMDHTYDRLDRSHNRSRYNRYSAGSSYNRYDPYDDLLY